MTKFLGTLFRSRRRRRKQKQTDLHRRGLEHPLDFVDEWATRTETQLEDEEAFSKPATAVFASENLKSSSPQGSSRRHLSQIIVPFVADLAFRSFVRRRSDSSKLSFKPYHCQAALLFVDLSGYSKITAAIAHRGAHALSSAVNAYLERLLQIIHRFGGDVVKFAGDAVLCVWEGGVADDDELEYNLLAATACALELQEKAGTHPVKQGTDLHFSIHCAVCYGTLESEIFAAPTHLYMQRLYHSVSGEGLVDISALIDLAGAGEIAIAEQVIDRLGDRVSYQDIDDVVGAKLLKALDMDHSTREAMLQHVTDILDDRAQRRMGHGVEEEFIHPKVLELLENGGQSPTQIAQMRNLCVLFIAKTSAGNNVNWLLEVQTILDEHRCPLIQILDDDKGTHLVAAINLFESVPESSLRGLEICQALVAKQLGCAIGIAMGSTFCGVTGSSSIACRWDVTGAPAVRAARLMQFALRTNQDVAIDASLFEDPAAVARMAILDPAVQIKGSSKPCAVYRLSASKLNAVFRVLEYSAVGESCVVTKAVQQVRKYINTRRQRCCVIVTGVPFSGKKLVCQKAAALSNLVPYCHCCDETAGLAQLARSIATWFSYAEDKSIRDLAGEVLDHMDKKRWSRAHDECVRLVNAALEAGLRACFVIERIYFLDSFSLSILRECLQEQAGVLGERRSASIYRRSESDFRSSSVGSDGFSERSSNLNRDDTKGKIVFLGCHMSLYDQKSAQNIADDITRANTAFRVRVVEANETTPDEARNVIREITDMEPEERWLRCYLEASGDSLDYFLQRVHAIRTLSARENDEYEVITRRLTLNIPPGCAQKNQQLPVTLISAEITMKFFQLFDELPHLFQIFVKVLAIGTSKALFKAPKTVLWLVMNDLVTEGVDAARFSDMLRDLENMKLLKIMSDGDIEKVVFRNPALADIAIDICTPSQISVISQALIFRLEPMLSYSFKIPLLVAHLCTKIDEEKSKIRALWKKAYEAFLREGIAMSPTKRDWWQEHISDFVVAAGDVPAEVLGQSFCVPCKAEAPVPLNVQLLGSYIPPISFGPLGHTLSVITRSVFHEYGARFRKDEDTMVKLRRAIESASERYYKQTRVLEDFLSTHELPAEDGFLKMEREMIECLSAPSDDENDVEEKAKIFVESFVQKIVKKRLERLRMLIETLCVQSDVPECFAEGNCDCALAAAYKKFQTNQCWKDSAEDALMVLATRNWKPRAVPEPLPQFYYQTVCRVRDELLKQVGEVTDNSADIRHQHCFEDFQAFLVTTVLLYKAQDDGRC